MEYLNDDILGLVLKSLQCKEDRSACAQVCSQWRRVEGLTRRKLRIIDPDSLTSFLSRFPNLVKLKADMLGDGDLRFVAQTCYRLQTIDLDVGKYRRALDFSLPPDHSSYELGDPGVCALASACKDLRRVSLRWRANVSDVGIISLSKSCTSLIYLNLAHCKRVTDSSLEALSQCNHLETLILSSCTAITDKGLSFLSNAATARSLRFLDLCQCDQLTDSGVIMLRKFSALEELSLAECGPRITDIGGVAIANIKTLRTVNLSWLINISDVSLLALAQTCFSLREVNVSGCELVTGVGLQAFSNHKFLQALILYACYNVFGDDVEQTANACPRLSYLGLDHTMRTWLSFDSLKKMQERIQIVWV